MKECIPIGLFIDYYIKLSQVSSSHNDNSQLGRAQVMSQDDSLKIYELQLGQKILT